MAVCETSIGLSKKLKEELRDLKEDGETFEDVIWFLINTRKSQNI